MTTCLAGSASSQTSGYLAHVAAGLPAICTTMGIQGCKPHGCAGLDPLSSTAPTASEMVRYLWAWLQVVPRRFTPVKSNASLELSAGNRGGRS